MCTRDWTTVPAEPSANQVDPTVGMLVVLSVSPLEWIDHVNELQDALEFEEASKLRADIPRNKRKLQQMTSKLNKLVSTLCMHIHIYIYIFNYTT